MIEHGGNRTKRRPGNNAFDAAKQDLKEIGMFWEEAQERCVVAVCPYVSLTHVLINQGPRTCMTYR